MATKITVNEKTYDSVDAMPPDVRAVYEQAMRAMGAARPAVHHSEIKVSFQMNGPHFKFRVGSGATPDPAASSIPSAPPTNPEPVPTEAPPPIEPGSGSAGLKLALVLGLGLAIGLAFWLWSGTH